MDSSLQDATSNEDVVTSTYKVSTYQAPFKLGKICATMFTKLRLPRPESLGRPEHIATETPGNCSVAYGFCGGVVWA